MVALPPAPPLDVDELLADEEPPFPAWELVELEVPPLGVLLSPPVANVPPLPAWGLVLLPARAPPWLVAPPAAPPDPGGWVESVETDDSLAPQPKAKRAVIKNREENARVLLWCCICVRGFSHSRRRRQPKLPSEFFH
jgi:hypothetical protein